MTAQRNSIESARIAARAADRIKADDIAAFDVSQPLPITDLMLVATGESERQVIAIADEIQKDLYLQDGGRQPLTVDGRSEGRWIVLDFGDIVVHVMHREAHDFYGLERLWGDCPRVDLQLPPSSARPDSVDERVAVESGAEGSDV
ncbi:iojap protein family [Bifidobacterium minimum]|uniref:Ribosomal silencing factor RsfS n=1 Tax=Bifidobacterium minimum TaxID=1693 RepID=A0A087BNF2_9BIFI|nr:ribosome silencing factor [Bifidobacterium minimum]KFI72552.1 iojap protein family [Bifidobacterium minimum]